MEIRFKLHNTLHISPYVCLESKPYRKLRIVAYVYSLNWIIGCEYWNNIYIAYILYFIYLRHSLLVLIRKNNYMVWCHVSID